MEIKDCKKLKSCARIFFGKWHQISRFLILKATGCQQSPTKMAGSFSTDISDMFSHKKFENRSTFDQVMIYLVFAKKAVFDLSQKI